MISGTRTPARREFLLRQAPALALLAAARPARAFALPELMTLLAARRSGEARFTEERFVQGLDAPLHSSGTLSFTAPDRLVRRTLSPRPESMVAEGNTLTLTRGGRSRSFALDAAPEMVALVEAIRGTLTGNAASLARHFRTRLSGDAERWLLELQPLDALLARQLRSVQIGGRRDEVRSVETLLAGGDRTTMAIEPVRAAPPAASAPP